MGSRTLFARNECLLSDSRVSWYAYQTASEGLIAMNGSTARFFIVATLRVVTIICISAFAGHLSAFADDSWKAHYPKLGPTAKKTVIVFIPGILGSRLIDPSTSKVVWGDFDLSSVPNLEFKEGHKFNSEPFLNAEIRALFQLGGYSVYGDAIRDIEVNAAATNSGLLKFHYDWRQSNFESATDLESWLCSTENSTLIGEHNLVFVAHSMGGLVLKHWFHLFFDEGKGCINKNNSAQRILKVILVGTPHYGSAKIIKNFFDGYSFGIPFVDSWISQRINKFGHTFPSVYELIPIQNNPACSSELEQFTGDSALEVEGSASAGELDLFAVQTFKALSIPKTIDESSRDIFLQNDLSKILEKAKALSCFAAKYKFPNLEKTKIVTYAGFVDIDNTPAAYEMLREQLSRRDRQSESIFLRVLRMERGDGTVTQSAANWANVTGFDYQKDCRNAHGQLMDDVSVTNYLATVSQNAYADALRSEVASSASYTQFVQQAADQHKILAVFPFLSDINTQFVAKLNLEIFESAGIASDEIWDIRSTVANQPVERLAVNWAYIAAGTNSLDRIIAAYEDIGVDLIRQGQADSAITQLDKAIEIWNSASLHTPSMTQTAGAAYNTRAAVNFQLQNSARARDDWVAAQSLGVGSASENLEHWGIQYGSPF